MSLAEAALFYFSKPVVNLALRTDPAYPSRASAHVPCTLHLFSTQHKDGCVTAEGIPPSVYIYIYTHTCIYICIYMIIYVSIYVYIYMHAYICLYIYVMFPYIHIDMCTGIYINIEHAAAEDPTP